MFNTLMVIDDSPNIREQIIATLREVNIFENFLEAGDGIDGFKILLNTPADLVLCDLEMPRMDGFKFIAMMQSREELKNIPVILLTGREDRDLKIKGLEQGAVDYVTKPFDAGELVARVKVQLKIKGLQDELKKTNEMLKELSNTDHLTGLYNRRYLMEAIEREYQRAQRKKEYLSLIIVDIDHFKQVNDTHGHQAGDSVLVTIGKYLSNMLRRYDLAARYGGEEFVAVLPDTPHEKALQLAERIRLGVQELAYQQDLKGLTITVSLGVATFPAEKIDCMDSLFRQADEALYRAKQRGRNRVEAMSGRVKEAGAA